MPWKHVTEKKVPDRATRNAMIKDAKQKLVAADVPDELTGFMDTVTGLKYEEGVDYDKWIAFFGERACGAFDTDWRVERKPGIKRCRKTLRNRRAYS